VHSLNRACQETCSVAEPDGSDMIYVARFPALKEMYINMPLGKRIPMYCTASGRAYLSRLPPDEALALLASSKRTAYTANTITDLTRLQALLDEARDQGFAWAESEYYSADINISAPILGPHGLPVGAVNISAAGSRFTLEQARRELGPQVVETARTISSSNLLRRAAPR
jgi:DNA-binding IclR family transcriptional regulator